jgi:phage shock protein A
MSLFSRLFKFAQSEAHSTLENLEDPVKMTEQGIRDLKADLHESIKSLAGAKALLMRVRREAEEKKQIAADYEGKAILLLKKAQAGEMDAVEADRLANEALKKKEMAMQQAAESVSGLRNQDQLVAKLENSVQNMREQIKRWESELTVLKSRAKIASATKKINKQLANVDSSSTIALLERMKDKVAQDEAIGESYSDISQQNTSIDNEIDQALKGSGKTSASLDELKAKLKIK